MRLTRNRLVCTLLCLTLWLIPSYNLNAQIAIKTNLVHGATATPNLGMEIGVARKSTIQLHYGLNPWNMKDNRKWKHWVLMPEYRWWLCNKFNGHFFGLHAMGGQFNLANINVPTTGHFFGGDNIRNEVRDKNYEGSFAGVGLTYGYQWILGRHFNIEAELGAGYVHAWYDKYNCGECGPKISDGQTNYVGLTKLGLSLLYLF